MKKGFLIILPILVFIVMLVHASQDAYSSDGRTIYEKACKLCHGSGMMGAPMVGDEDLWADRVAKGIDVLYDHAITGYKGMIKKGGKWAYLSDDDVKVAVNYMVIHSK